MALTTEQIRHFRHCGYLKLPGRLPAESVEALKATIRRAMDAGVEPLVRNEAGQVVRLSRVLAREPIFGQTAACPPVLDALESLLGPAIELVQNRHNHATLNLASGRADHFHRDAIQWSRGLVTVIFYLEETTTANGCTQIIPGTHLLPGVGQLHRVEEEDWVRRADIAAQAVPVPMPAGSMLAIDGLVFHRIGPNSTEQTRMSLTFGYHSADELGRGSTPDRVLVRGAHRYQGNDPKV